VETGRALRRLRRLRIAEAQHAARRVGLLRERLGVELGARVDARDLDENVLGDDAEHVALLSACS
jgi:hypothetical protein